MKRLFAVAVLAGLAASQAGAQSLKINLIRVANPGALSMPGMPGMPSTFPNTYTNTTSFSFDPNHGSEGTLYVNWNFTGTTGSSPMLYNTTAKHYPTINVEVINNGTGKSVHYAQGGQVAPSAQMNQTLTIAFDIGADQCTLDLFIDGTCLLYEEQDGVTCTVAGAFVFLIRKFQFEYAHSRTQNIGTAYPFPQETWCDPPSDPPDWWLRNALVQPPTGFLDSAAELVRSQFIGLAFTGQPWFQLQPFGFPQDVPAGSPKVICTQNDKGCVWGATSCTGQPTK